MLTWRPLLGVAVAGVLLGGCAHPVEDDVLATVDRVAITQRQVESLLVPEAGSVVRVVGEADPAQVALDLAIRDQLLAYEADRRGLVADGRAAQLHRLVTAEREGHPELVAAAISEEEARAWYGQRRAEFDEVETARVRWLELVDEAAAQRVFQRVTDGDRTVFADPGVAGVPVARTGSAWIEHDQGAGETVRRITNAVRRPGGVGLDQDPVTGTWYLLQVDAVTFEDPPWDAGRATKIKTAMAWEREQRHLADLAEAVRADRPVRRYPDNVQRLRQDDQGGDR